MKKYFILVLAVFLSLSMTVLSYATVDNSDQVQGKVQGDGSIAHCIVDVFSAELTDCWYPAFPGYTTMNQVHSWSR